MGDGNMTAATKNSMQTTPLVAPALSVSELTRKIKRLLDGQIGAVTVEGETSNVKRVSSGHIYFSLKDANSQLPCAWFLNQQRPGSIELKDGLQLRIDGDITVYETRGYYQLVVRRIAPAGLGALQQQFEALKAQLQKEGLFDSSRKKPLPFLPRCIGLVTSPTGAVIRDMLTIFKRRFPNLHFLLAPARVQGEGAAAEIAAALDLLNEQGQADLIILARGGGSIEDLWAFNEEIVARAIARSSRPVISAVGHETDFTISDFVADLRAPTPSAAAELACPARDELLQRIDDQHRSLQQALRRELTQRQHRLQTAAAHPVFREPRRVVQTHREQLVRHAGSLSRGLRAFLRDRRHDLALSAQSLAHTVRAATKPPGAELPLLQQRMNHALKMLIAAQRQRLGAHVATLGAMSPFAVLQRGYSLTTTDDGQIVTRASTLKPGQTLRTRFSQGQILSDVTHIDDSEETRKP